MFLVFVDATADATNVVVALTDANASLFVYILVNFTFSCQSHAEH